MGEVYQKGKLAKKASYQLLNYTTDEKNEALLLISNQLIEEKDLIIKENKKDLQSGAENGLSTSILDRIMLDEKRIEDMASALKELVKLKDPVGEVVEEMEKENGLKIRKKTVPIGVMGMIYEARPNVTIDAASLALKTGNSIVLRGSSSAKHSNMALVNTIHRALDKSVLPRDAVQLIEDTSRETAKELFHLKEFLDVLIPRGGKGLIDTVVKEATVPVIETGAGNCHLFIDETADREMAFNISLNGKTQRPSVCNALETILIEKNWFDQYGLSLLEALHNNAVEIYGDNTVCSSFSFAKEATVEDWYTEYSALKISIKVVEDVIDAISHINTYGTKHSEAIITENKENAELFLSGVDAAAVYHNASTRFTDGFEFGYGAEIGISTQKLHARGPMGLNALTSVKYFIYGDGQVRK
ncbi:glutamate-5-semialdehyde dehydrogenase [Cytobacillus oceanisediminis]|uniref:Gamma-glutamyl phosphate reductase n=1 Tax=Niallia alba TaxID=2729105 RepID=A0A7Y0K8U5_9BACI|nr:MULTISPECIES: glutamate-5-semialdehyde dehydrogenase [Bacillaceae]MBQ6446820.1 glutamate-5-semialdehyde dehydrogenase [Bacillus sp. (in: firmicutes)]MBZ9534153.1 glutamate-5-semialdehyde dehydrogenase [Cytobacillus oceanisediminis]NMO77993.1 glutamate-5-semialdehyde dehydrogenase [Niallia alba]UTI41275.1 glutamate-5-semialdehyde dehydrogenase [Niallia sp. RD1]